ILNLVKKHYEGRAEGAVFNREEHHRLAKKMSAECAVLLKNDNILPLKETTKAAFIGEFAVVPRFQGGGSSHINSFMVTSAMEAAKGYHVSFAKGYETMKDEPDENLIREAVELAKESEVAVVFAGLPDHYESEGYDRTHLNLPACQNVLIDEIVKVQPNTLVVLHNGSPVVLLWADKVKGILEVYLGGQAVGEATVDLLYGKVNPSGKLAETFPLRLQDNPSYLNFPGTSRTVEYKEGVYIGYRYYDAKDMDVLYPFGFGLSYTTFDYGDLKLRVIDSDHIPSTDGKLHMKDTQRLEVKVTVKNTGNVNGKEIVQLYVRDIEASVGRPIKELKGFAKVALAPGEEKEVVFTLDKRSFAYYSMELNDWYAENGTYEILIGKSSRDIILKGSVEIESSDRIPFVVDDRTTYGDVINQLADPGEFYRAVMESSGYDPEHDDTIGEFKMFIEMIKGTPLHAGRSIATMGMHMDKFDDLLKSMLDNSKRS
ncbi:MAG TPA: glycoside hydrolase family 3 C-terminal domain-containing protein, partial [Mobilitalea sp.]|nr:glycoside hydrolase family 3 C-terminal domain-containing protein [Mobilitalea sp.]